MSSSSPTLREPSPIKRAPRAYGRRKVPEIVLPNDPDDSFTSGSVPDTSISKSSPFKPVSPLTTEDVPPSSDAGSSPSGTGEFEFGWKAKLKAMDESDEEEEGTGRDVLPADLKSSFQDAAEGKNKGISRAATEILSDDVFGGSLGELTTSQGSITTQDNPAILSHSPSPPPSKPIRKRRAIAIESDSGDGEHAHEFQGRKLANSQSSNGASPILQPNLINSPKQRSSPTPPTSDEEMASVEEPQVKSRKGKGKVKHVQPLQFNTDPDVSANVKKAKGRTRLRGKKEHEAVRERVRNAFDQAPSILRTEDHKYTVGSLFALIADTGRNISKAPSSDPIQPFSSSPADNFRSAPPPSKPRASLPFRSLNNFQPLSSSALHQTTTRRPSSSAPPVTRPIRPEGSLPKLDDSDDEVAMPDISTLLQEDQQKRVAAQKQKDLLELKMRLVAQKKQAEGIILPDSDEDLEVVDAHENMHVVADEEADERKARKVHHIKPSEGRKRQLLHRGISAKEKKEGYSSPVKGGRRTAALSALKEHAKPFGGTRNGSIRDVKRKEKMGMTQDELNRFLAKSVREKNREMMQKKEDEWVRRGGRVFPENAGGAGLGGIQAATTVYAEKVLNGAESKEGVVMEEDEDEDGDGDWVSNMGSASPEPKELGSEDEELNAENVESGLLVDDEGDENQGSLDELSLASPIRGGRRSIAVVQSDSEESMGSPSPSGPKRVLRTYGRTGKSNIVDDNPFLPSFQTPVRHGSPSLFEDRSDGEENKENEDKENRSTAGHPTPFRRSVSATGDSLPRPPLGDIGGGGEGEDDEDLFISPSRAPGSTLTARLKKLSPNKSKSPDGSPLLGLQPLDFGQHRAEIGFSQFTEGEEEGENDENRPPPLVVKTKVLAKSEGSLLFGFDPQEGKALPGPRASSPLEIAPLNTGGGFSQFSDDEGEAPGPSKLLGPITDDISLTLDVQKAGLIVSSTLQRRADAIFEKEQALVIEEAVKKPPKKPEIYVNDHGFLTQTRPDVSSPEIYKFASPSQPFPSSVRRNGSQSAFLLQSAQRHPLQDLSIFDELETPVANHRLRRRSSSPDPSSSTHTRPRLSSRSTSPLKGEASKPNAFETLLRNAAAKEERRKEKSLLKQRSEFVEAEALESDDDDLLGFGDRRKKNGGGEDEDEAAGEDLDATLEGLVDDAAMDEETQAVLKVQEKAREHAEQDDAVLEKLHRDAAEGKFRFKRRNNGVGLDESDDDDEEDENAAKIRRRMNKKRKIEGDNLEELGKNEETRAFYEAYQRDLADDDELAFGHLRSDVLRNVADVESGGQEGLEGEDTEQREIAEGSVSVNEVRDRIRGMKANGETFDTVDPNDVSWLDDEEARDDQDPVRYRVKQVSHPRHSTFERRLPHRPAFGPSEFDGTSQLEILPKTIVENERERDRMSSWAKVENKSRNIGTGRMTVGAAVTGHSTKSSKAKSGGGSLRSVPSVSQAREPIKRPPVKAQSMLSVVSDRSNRFA